MRRAVLASIVGIPGALVLGLLIGIVRLAATLPLASVTLPPILAAAAAALLVAIPLACRRTAADPAGPGRRGGSRAHAAGPRRTAGRREWRDRAARRTSGPDNRPRSGRPASPPRDRRSARILRLAGIFGALAIAVLLVAGATRPDGRAHVVVLDVGQGDAILVTGPTGGRMLVDGGPDADRLLVALDARVPPWDRRIDLIVLTHPHEDHVGGLPLVLERYRVGQVVEPGMPGRSPGYEALETILAARGTASGRLVAGDHFALDGIAMDVLWPDADRVPREASDDGSEVNDASIVLLGSFEGRRFLLMGDAEAEVEGELAARRPPDRGPAQDRPPRKPDVDDGRAGRGDAPPRGGDLGGRTERLRASIARRPGPPGRRRVGRPADRPGRVRSTWRSAPPASRFGPSARTTGTTSEQSCGRRSTPAASPAGRRAPV